MPSFKAAAIEVLAGDVDTAVVRWVHSSEVYEMGGLLSGGEVLLTTGLGLHGRSPEQLTAYIDQLADAGCVALAMEVGRSFLTAPPELVEASRRRGLAFLALHAVVPFERMVEDFHDLMLRRTLGSAQAGEPVWQELLSLVVAGQGMTALLDKVSRLAGCGVDLLDADGRTVERSTTGAERSETERTIHDVRGPTNSLGRLVLCGPATTRRTAVANCAAVAVALELGRHGDLGPRQSLAQSVITDVVGGVLTSHGDLSERLTAAGWTPLSEGHHVLVAAVDIDRQTPVRELADQVRDAVRAVLGSCVVGTAANHVIVLAHGWASASPARAVADLSGVGAAVAQAREVVQIARRFGSRTGVILARDVGVQRLLAAGTTPASLSVFVTEQLGSLIAYDTAHSADLVRTLDAYLAHRGGKARTADFLGIRRQSLYARLTRIEKLMGVSLDDPAQVVCLGLALTAWRMRTGLDPQAAFERLPG
ncbi:PucR family transcriptional regulator [Rhodococcus sp. YH3-3]|uniref:PucR family transcriptional regulator n=1 Tax=Rhodococcus sp. YH3-3 TaxID=1803579 RepID=UPI001EE7737E|nr:PucR family transcriptional regulator [Rhodococcus sp. YH3-3]